MRKLVLLLLIFCFFPVVSAHSHYSFEHSKLMHDTNVVEWREYGPDAFAESASMNKPVFLMLTAPTWCYWCHVYTSDDYVYHPTIAKRLNEEFVPIYVNADYRQDLTRQYLEGGWPSTTVFTPSRERMFGFSGPRPVQWMDENLANAAQFVSSQGYANIPTLRYESKNYSIPTQEELIQLPSSFAGHLLHSFDSEHGGFGTGQKFPQGRTLDFALDLYEQTGQSRWLQVVLVTLENQYTASDLQDYNLFDPLDGGFHRYGTARDWSPPHYEKMLYDNARLLIAYDHLLDIAPTNNKAQEVVSKTNVFMLTQWYDPLGGGFYGNSDVHGEHEYYGKNPRPSDKPRVETTKYTDWNAQAALAYLTLYERNTNDTYKNVAINTLSLLDSLHTTQGMLHYKTPAGETGVQGSLLDNAYGLLAFVEAYDVLADDLYKETSIQIADYSLDNLYDWHGGGFFERNSEDLEIYAPNEHIRFSKPSEENAIMSYALLKLYSHTKDPRYLHAALTTLGEFVGQTPGLDRGYYWAKSAQLATQMDALGQYTTHAVEQVVQENQKSFWANTYQPQPEFVVSNAESELAHLSLIILLFIAFIAGMLSFLSPCTLPIAPAFVAQSLQSSKRHLIGMSVCFVLGLSSMFALLGVGAAALGLNLSTLNPHFFVVLGILLSLVGVGIALGQGLRSLPFTLRKPVGYTSAVGFGALMALAWTPCEGLILIALLILAASADTLFTGGLALFVYGLGLSLPLIIIGVMVRNTSSTSKISTFLKGKSFSVTVLGKKIHLHSTSLISGVLFILLGILIATGSLTAFNQYVASSALQEILYTLERSLFSILT